jgi:hypothetical protein
MTCEFSGWVRLEISPVSFACTVLVLATKRNSKLRPETAEHAAPTGLGDLLGHGYYKHAAPSGASRRPGQNVKEPAFVPQGRDFGAASRLHVREALAHRARILAERGIFLSS